jgi:uncharacterized membrane protein YjfL (UPF0719 family)
MGIEIIVINLVAVFVQLVLSLAFAMGSVYIGLKLFDRMTEGIDEMAELKKGNVAVAILLGAIIFSIANVVEGGVTALMGSVTPGLTLPVMAAAFVIGLVNLLVSLILAIITIYVALSILDKITVDIDEFKELKRGNVAVAIVMASVLFAVSFVIRGAVASMSSGLSAESVATALGWA